MTLETQLEASRANAGVIEALRARLGERLTTAAAVCQQHGTDESYHAPFAPDAVAFAETTEEVAEIVKICAQAR